MTVPNTPHHPAEDERFGGRHRHEKEEVASAEADEWNENVGMAAERQRVKAQGEKKAAQQSGVKFSCFIKGK